MSDRVNTVVTTVTREHEPCAIEAQPNLTPTPADYIAFPAATVLCVYKQLPGCTVAM